MWRAQKKKKKNLLTEIDESRLTHSFSLLWCPSCGVLGKVSILKKEDIWNVNKKTCIWFHNTQFIIRVTALNFSAAAASFSDRAVSTAVRETLLIWMCMWMREQWVTLWKELNDLQHTEERHPAGFDEGVDSDWWTVKWNPQHYSSYPFHYTINPLRKTLARCSKRVPENVCSCTSAILKPCPKM